MEIKPIRFYGRRIARALKPQAAERYTHTLKGYTFTRDTLESLFNKPVWLEIGFGGGEHLAYQAKANPNVNFIGAEAFCAGVAHMVEYIEGGKLRNVWIYPDDVQAYAAPPA
jgi:tRNA (guanine-N7-)-methyltransferase